MDVGLEACTQGLHGRGEGVLPVGLIGHKPRVAGGSGAAEDASSICTCGLRKTANLMDGLAGAGHAGDLLGESWGVDFLGRSGILC